MKIYALPTEFVPIAGHLSGMFLATVVNSRPWNTSLMLPTPHPAQLISGVQGASLQRDPASLTRQYRCECGFFRRWHRSCNYGVGLGVRSLLGSTAPKKVP